LRKSDETTDIVIDKEGNKAGSSLKRPTESSCQSGRQSGVISNSGEAADKTTLKQPTKRRLLLRESDDATDKESVNATDKSALSLERKLPSDKQSSQIRYLSRESDEGTDRATEKAAIYLDRKLQKNDRVTERTADKASSSLQKNRGGNRKSNQQSGIQAASYLETLERERQSGIFSLVKATMRLEEQPNQWRLLWRESNIATDRETNNEADEAAPSFERTQHNNRWSGYFSLRKTTSFGRATLMELMIKTGGIDTIAARAVSGCISHSGCTTHFACSLSHSLLAH
jgi:hypothetical protein